MHHKWIDRWKGLLILLVVFGHAVGAAGNLAHGETADVLLRIRCFIYLFHMPAFFILAGVCWKTPVVTNWQNEFRCFLGKRFLRLIIPYLIFGVFSWCVFNVMKGTWEEFLQQMRHLLIADGHYECNSVLWFLPVMYVVLVISKVIDWSVAKFWENRLRRVIVCVVVISYMTCFLLRYNHISDLPLMPLNVAKYLCFFLIGRMLKKNVPNVGSALFVFLVFVLCVPVFVHYDTRPFLGYSIWMVQGMSGALVSAAIVRVMPDKWFGWLEWIGAMSMGIMLIHKFPMVAIQEHISVVRSLFGGDLFLALTGCIFVFIASAGCSIVGVIVLKKFFPMSVGERKCIG